MIFEISNGGLMEIGKGQTTLVSVTTQTCSNAFGNACPMQIRRIASGRTTRQVNEHHRKS